MLLLFCVVMGGIYFGVFTPTEAADFGAFGAFLFALFKRKLSVRSLIRCLLDTGKTTAMIFFIIIGANIFSTFLGLARIPMGLAISSPAWPCRKWWFWPESYGFTSSLDASWIVTPL